MRVPIVVLTAAAVILFSACAGDSKDGATPTTSAPSSVPSTSAQTALPGCPTPPAGPVTSLSYAGDRTAEGQAVLNAVQVTTSSCSDTATFTFGGAFVPGYSVKYVPATSECGSGQPVTTAGAAQLYLRLEPAVAHNDAGSPTIGGRSQSPNFPSIQELKLTCDFEGVVAWAIGTAEKYFTVTTASNPGRIIVEVSH